MTRYRVVRGRPGPGRIVAFAGAGAALGVITSLHDGPLSVLVWAVVGGLIGAMAASW